MNNMKNFFKNLGEIRHKSLNRQATEAGASFVSVDLKYYPQGIDMTPLSLINLPREMHIEILGKLPAGSLKVTLLINSYFQTISCDNALWKRHLKNDFPKARLTTASSPLTLYTERKRQQIKFLELNAQRLFIFVEENNLGKIAETLQQAVTPVTRLLHTKTKDGVTLTALINTQNNQELRDYFFQKIHEEYEQPPPIPPKKTCGRLWKWIFSKNTVSPVSQRCDRGGFYLFHWACLFGQIKFLNQPEMLAIDADQPIKNYYRETALRLCVKNGSWDGLRYVIQRGANINLQSTNGDTAISLATRSGRLDQVEFLLSQGAILFPAPHRFICPLNSATKSGQIELVRYLFNHFRSFLDEQSIKKAATSAIKYGHLDLLDFLFPHLSMHPNLLLKYVDFSEGFGECLDPLIFLLNKGAAVDHPCKGMYKGNTCLYEAVNFNHWEAAKILLKRGANPDKASLDVPQFPIERAIEWESKNMIELLIDHGASINQRILKAARKTGNEMIIELLEDLVIQGRGMKRARED